MIDLRFDLDGIDDGSARLGSLLDERSQRLSALAAAEAYTDAIFDWIGAGNSFTSRTGALEQSIGWRPAGNGAVVFANSEIAPYIEEGTGLHGPRGRKYVIAPKQDAGRQTKIDLGNGQSRDHTRHGGARNALRIPLPGGKYRFAKSVLHPGIEADPFFFADFPRREEIMLDAARGVLAQQLSRR